MEKRYQVFVSSTFADLKEERRKVIQTLMEMDCIPSGMEIFPAADEEQWEFIKKVISDCDYYILIIGGRYGSLTSEGISYTEKEYDYAVSIGLKVLAFLHENPNEIPVKKSELDPHLREKLISFRNRVSQGRIVKFWNKAEELSGLVALSLQKTIKTYPSVGWVRANIVANAEVLNEVNELRKRNDELSQYVAQLESQIAPSPIENIAELDDEITVFGEYNESLMPEWKRWEHKLSWRKLFSLIAPFLLENPNDELVRKKLKNSFLEKIDRNLPHALQSEINEQIYQTVKIQLMALKLVDIRYSQSTTGNMALFWSLTKTGNNLLFQLRTTKKET